MEIACGYCKTIFELTSKQVKSEKVDRNPFEVLLNGIFGIEQGGNSVKKTQYFIECEKCRRKIGVFYSPILDI